VIQHSGAKWRPLNNIVTWWHYPSFLFIVYNFRAVPLPWGYKQANSIFELREWCWKRPATATLPKNFFLHHISRIRKSRNFSQAFIMCLLLKISILIHRSNCYINFKIWNYNILSLSSFIRAWDRQNLKEILAEFFVFFLYCLFTINCVTMYNEQPWTWTNWTISIKLATNCHLINYPVCVGGGTDTCTLHNSHNYVTA